MLLDQMNGSTANVIDEDPDETEDWLSALESVVAASGMDRAEFLLAALNQRAKALGVSADISPFSPYRNSIPLDRQPPYPGDLAMEERITAIIRWNALAMVVRANRAYGELGGHIASYASAAEIFEIGFNHFFRGPDANGGADLVFFLTSFSAGRLCTRVPGRSTADRASRPLSSGGVGQRAVFLSASVVDARVLAVSDGLHGYRAHQRYLSRPLHAVSRESWTREHRAASRLGRVRRWRNGRAGVHRR